MAPDRFEAGAVVKGAMLDFYCDIPGLLCLFCLFHVHSWWPPGPVLFSIFTGDLDKGIECTPNKFMDNTKLGGNVDLLEGGKSLQGIWTGWINGLRPMERGSFNKAKCQVLPLGHSNPRLCCRLGTVAGKLSMEKDLGVPVS
ncbi:hypothetical protein TURU_097944 [Turdus rufiventris]|nr:hypothetical protein TURU_097944 [Turdus rufiventris]